MPDGLTQSPARRAGSRNNRRKSIPTGAGQGPFGAQDPYERNGKDNQKSANKTTPSKPLALKGVSKHARPDGLCGKKDGRFCRRNAFLAFGLKQNTSKADYDA